MKYIVSVLILLFIGACSGGKKVIGIHNNNSVLDKYASILNASASDINNVKLYTFIDDWYGAKYKYGGMSKEGVDCSGFCNILYSEVYGKKIERTTLGLSNTIDRVGKDKLQEGDLVFFNISKKKNSHVGVYLKNRKFVHASTSKGVIISSIDNPYYEKTYSKGGGL